MSMLKGSSKFLIVTNRYIAASLLPKKMLEEQIRKEAKSDSFAACLHDRLEFVDEVRDIYEDSFSK